MGYEKRAADRNKPVRTRESWGESSIISGGPKRLIISVNDIFLSKIWLQVQQPIEKHSSAGVGQGGGGLVFFPMEDEKES